MVTSLPLKGPRYRARLGPYHSVPPLLCATFLVADFTVRRMTVVMRRCTHTNFVRKATARGVSTKVRSQNTQSSGRSAGRIRQTWAWALAMPAVDQGSRGSSS